jgi:hypothetical protein
MLDAVMPMRGRLAIGHVRVLAKLALLSEGSGHVRTEWRSRALHKERTRKGAASPSTINTNPMTGMDLITSSVSAAAVVVRPTLVRAFPG